jgi:hypothetical protein
MIPGTNYAVPSEWIREEDNAEVKNFVKNLFKGIDGNKKKALKKAIRASLIILHDICA